MDPVEQLGAVAVFTWGTDKEKPSLSFKGHVPFKIQKDAGLFPPENAPYTQIFAYDFQRFKDSLKPPWSPHSTPLRKAIHLFIGSFLHSTQIFFEHF